MLRLLWILLLLPVVELVLTVALYNRYSTPFLGFLLLGAVLGAALIGRAKASLRATLVALQQGDMRVVNGSLWSLLAGARSLFAGALLMFPGVLSDVLALVVLLLPGKWLAGRAGVGPKAANDDVIDVEFREVREEYRLPRDK